MSIEVNKAIVRRWSDDLWSWNGSVWTLRCTGCTGVPRDSVALGPDPPGGRLVATGGYTGTAELAGTWVSDGSTLVLEDDTYPPSRDNSGIVYDVGRNVLVLYGGNGDSCGGSNCADTYEYLLSH